MKIISHYNKLILPLIKTWYWCVAGAMSIINASAQQQFTLEQALQMAVQQNAAIKNEQLNVEYHKILTDTYKDIPKTNIYTEMGQVNSALFDTKFGISQSFSLPVVYQQQRALLSAQYQSVFAHTAVQVWEVKKAVSEIFYHYQYLKQKEKLLQHSDSLYQQFYQKAVLRLQKGESNVLEKTTAETQKAAIEMQRLQLRQEMETALVLFQYLLNTPQAEPLPLPEADIPLLTLDTTALNMHPTLKVLEEQREVARQTTLLEKARLRPDFSVALNNTSFRGTGADDRHYKGTARFTSAQFGMAIPLFKKSQRTKIEAMQVNESIAEQAWHFQKQHLQTEYLKWQAVYRAQQQQLEYFENKGLQNAALIQQTAQIQFQGGEINYLEYVLLLNQSIDIQNQALEARNNVVNTILQLNYLTH